MKIANGKNLIPGCLYRITAIDPTDRDPSLKVGDLVRCQAERAGCIDPENHESDGMGAQWFADYDGEEAYRTLVTGVEYVSGPDLKSSVPFEANVTVGCPFCKGTFRADDGKKSGTAGVVHTQPTCSKFDELDPLEFLTAVNTEIRTREGIGYA